MNSSLYATGTFVRRSPAGRIRAMNCLVPGCAADENLVEHWDPICWRLCAGHQVVAQRELAQSPGLSAGALVILLARLERRAA